VGSRQQERRQQGWSTLVAEAIRYIRWAKSEGAGREALARGEFRVSLEAVSRDLGNN